MKAALQLIPGVRRMPNLVAAPPALRGRIDAMENQYTGVFEQVDNWWTGFVEELPGCNVQEATLDEARASRKEAIQESLQANRELARREAEGHKVLRELLAGPVA